MRIQLPIRYGPVSLVIAGLALAVVYSGCSQQESRNSSGASAGDRVAVTTCDGEGKAMVSKDATGEVLAGALMDQWKRDHSDSDWVAEEKEKHELEPPADNSALLDGAQAEGHTYGRVTARDLVVWAREAEKFAVEGSRIFHSADRPLAHSEGVPQAWHAATEGHAPLPPGGRQPASGDEPPPVWSSASRVIASMSRPAWISPDRRSGIPHPGSSS